MITHTLAMSQGSDGEDQDSGRRHSTPIKSNYTILSLSSQTPQSQQPDTIPHPIFTPIDSRKRPDYHRQSQIRSSRD